MSDYRDPPSTRSERVGAIIAEIRRYLAEHPGPSATKDRQAAPVTRRAAESPYPAPMLPYADVYGETATESAEG